MMVQLKNELYHTLLIMNDREQRHVHQQQGSASHATGKF